MYQLVRRNCDRTGRVVTYTLFSTVDGVHYTVDRDDLLKLAAKGVLDEKVVNKQGNVNAAFMKSVPKCVTNALLKQTAPISDTLITVYIGAALQQELNYQLDKTWRKRPEFAAVMQHCHGVLRPGNKKAHTLVLTGLRRTGKTVLLLQAMQQLLNEGVSAYEIVFLTVQRNNLDIAVLTDRICSLPQGLKYVFIDEATRCTELLSGGLQIVDTQVAPLTNAHVVLSGTESFVYNVGTDTYWYDRVTMLQMKHLQYNEYMNK